MNTKDQLEIVKLAQSLIVKAIAEDAYADIVMQNAPNACLELLKKLRVYLESSVKSQETLITYSLEVVQ